MTRLASRLGSEQVRLSALLLLTLRGTPFLYYGDELGLPNIHVPPESIQDPWEQVQPGAGRDAERAPMPWSAEPLAGFSESEPWLPLPSDRAHFSVAMQLRDDTSTLRLYQQLIALRHASPALQQGSFSALMEIPKHVFAYRRSSSHQTMLIALNFDSVSHTLELPDKESVWAIQLSTHLNREDRVGRDLVLHPYEGVLLERFDMPTMHLNTSTTQ